jgi:guanylate kinase
VPGQVFVVTAPSGTGKTTLLKALLHADPRLRFSISFTTRPPRPEEVPGQDYFFTTPEEFRRLQEAGALVEWVEQFGYGYGTSREWVLKALAAGVDLVFDLDPRGARAMKQEFPQGVFIFILPPSLEQLRLRLQVRGDLAPAELRARLQQGQAELREVDWYDYLVVNDDLKEALEELKAIVAAARCRTTLRWPQLKPRLTSLFP